MKWVCLSNAIERKTHRLTLNVYFKKVSMGDMIQNWLFRRMTLMCGGQGQLSGAGDISSRPLIDLLAQL